MWGEVSEGGRKDRGKEEKRKILGKPRELKIESTKDGVARAQK